MTEALVAALLSVFYKIVTKGFFEKVVTTLIIKGGNKLVKHTTNTLDDELMIVVEDALSTRPEKEHN